MTTDSDLLQEALVNRLIRYAYLDVVGYSHNRSVEAQAEIIGILNECVTGAVEQVGKPPVLFIPTGDGICIAFTGPLSGYDIHIKFALAVLKAIQDKNSFQKDPKRSFLIRIGLSENTDTIVTDINGHQNVAGAGINLAQRIMSLADGSNILVSENTFNTLNQREAYQDKFLHFRSVVKHDLEINCYQFQGDFEGLSSNTPGRLLVKEDPIDEQLRKCLTEAGRSSGERFCFHEASKSWMEKIAKFDPPYGLNDKEKSEFEAISGEAWNLLIRYKKLLGAIYSGFQGSIHLDFQAVEKMELNKGYYNLLKKFETLVYDRVDEDRSKVAENGDA